MDLDEFWTLIDGARAQAQPLDGESMAAALQRQLLTRTPSEVVEFGAQFERLHAAAYRWDLWAAAYVIHGGCSDDGFDYFRSGLIALGRDAYEVALADPDALAGNPMVQAIAADVDHDEDLHLEWEEVDYAAAQAYEELLGIENGSGDEFYDAIVALQGEPESEADAEPDGEAFDFDDDAEMARRLPRLAALFGLTDGDDARD